MFAQVALAFFLRGKQFTMLNIRITLQRAGDHLSKLPKKNLPFSFHPLPKRKQHKYHAFFLVHLTQRLIEQGHVTYLTRRLSHLLQHLFPKNMQDSAHFTSQDSPLYLHMPCAWHQQSIIQEKITYAKLVKHLLDPNRALMNPYDKKLRAQVEQMDMLAVQILYLASMNEEDAMAGDAVRVFVLYAEQNAKAKLDGITMQRWKEAFTQKKIRFHEQRFEHSLLLNVQYL